MHDNPEPRLHAGPGRPRTRPEGYQFYEQRRKWLAYKILAAASAAMETQLCKGKRGLSEQKAKAHVIRWAKGIERRLKRATYCDLVKLYRKAYPS